MFRQAMRSPIIMFHVVPSSMKVQYEQLSHVERNPAYASGRFSPDSHIDHTPQRMSRHGPHPHPHSHAHPEQNNGYTPLNHPTVSAAKPPTGHINSPQRAMSSTPTGGYAKKVGRRLNIQLRKGELNNGRSLPHFLSPFFPSLSVCFCPRLMHIQQQCPPVDQLHRAFDGCSFRPRSL